MPKKHTVRASVLNSAHKKGETAFVVATAGDTLPKVETATYGCSNCNAVFASAKGMEPFCVCCGSHKVKAETDQQAPDLPEDSDDVVAVRCSTCGAHNGMSAVTASAMKGKVHCVECGTGLTYDSDEVKAATAADTTEVHKPNQVTAPPKQEVPVDGTTVNTPQKPDPVIVVESSDMQLDQNPSGKMQTEVDLVSAVLACDTPGELSLERSQDRLVAYIGETPVACLTKANAADPMQQVFDTDSLVAAIMRQASEQGIQQALSQYNFAPYKVQLPVDPYVNKLVAEQTQQLQQQQAEHAEDLMQCVSIAATGLNRNVFKGKSNALKAAFTSLLSSCGVRGADAAVERVFAACGDDYHKQLLATAMELKQKPLDVRNSLAESLAGMNTITATEQSEDDDESVDIGTIPIGTRLEQSAVKAASTTPSSRAVVHASTAIGALTAQAGGKLF